MFAVQSFVGTKKYVHLEFKILENNLAVINEQH